MPSEALSPTGSTVGFIGAGRAATALARGLRDVGYDIRAVASRTDASAERLASAIGAAAVDAQTVADMADMVFITTPDDAIGAVASAIAWRSGQQVVHASGALTLAPLDPARVAGAQVGSIHPVQTLLGTGDDSLAGVTFGIEADGRLRASLFQMAERLGGEPIDVPAEARALYHAAAIMSCGYLTSLLHDAATAWVRAGLDVDKGVRALTRMAAATVANVRQGGFDAALTGPIARGDQATVLAHLASLRRTAPDLVDGYIANGRRMAVLAGESGRADVAAWEELFTQETSPRSNRTEA